MKEPSLHAQGSGRTTLAAIVEALAAGGERDRAFVRRLGAWMDAVGPRVSLPFVERLGLTDVVVTLQMKRSVQLVVTGWLGDPPADATLRVDERDFPFVAVELLAEPRPDGYAFCTLDFGPRGRPARLTAAADGVAEAPGTTGVCQVLSTHGDRLFVRVELPGGRVVLWPAEAVDLSGP